MNTKIKFGEKKERKLASAVETNAAVLPAAFVCMVLLFFIPVCDYSRIKLVFNG